MPGVPLLYASKPDRWSIIERLSAALKTSIVLLLAILLAIPTEWDSPWVVRWMLNGKYGMASVHVLVCPSAITFWGAGRVESTAATPEELLGVGIPVRVSFGTINCHFLHLPERVIVDYENQIRNAGGSKIENPDTGFLVRSWVNGNSFSNIVIQVPSWSIVLSAFFFFVHGRRTARRSSVGENWRTIRGQESIAAEEEKGTSLIGRKKGTSLKEKGDITDFR